LTEVVLGILQQLIAVGCPEHCIDKNCQASPFLWGKKVDVLVFYNKLQKSAGLR
jgi:hypothetical protein